MPQILTIIIKGGIVMIPLLACSLISLALSIERILFWTRLKSRAVINESSRWSRRESTNRL